MSLDTLFNKVEARIARVMVREALAKGYAISVNDGEDWAIKRSTNYEEITAAMSSTDEDILHFRDSGGNKIGWVQLIYGNGDDLVSDSANNEAMEALCDEVTRKWPHA